MTKNTRRERLGAAGQTPCRNPGYRNIIILILQNLLGYVQVQSAPPGWQILRPPHEVSTLIIVNDTVWTGGKEGVILIDRTLGDEDWHTGKRTFIWVCAADPPGP